MFNLIFQKAKDSALHFRREFKKQIVTGITAGFAFLVALSWREPIKEMVDQLISHLGIGQQLFYKFISAIVVTFIAVLVLIILSKWASESEK